ncbi:hypothetical protein PFBG_01456 [Plasmodium falciparum 7G8]|uniref:Uncharacterized protein n=1 Tax=Plasmodium falciparum (isolate 7G8) TaxID=57266 RepID=W7FRL8_PLAF8|nr:hypothetical protein PFBG_01456 [Plasmodium falciparum 7G8]
MSFFPLNLKFHIYVNNIYTLKNGQEKKKKKKKKIFLIRNYRLYTINLNKYLNVNEFNLKNRNKYKKKLENIKKKRKRKRKNWDEGKDEYY